VIKTGTLYVNGWATDTASGAPVNSVTVLVDGNSMGSATLGSSRSDVKNFFGRSDYAGSGWSFQTTVSALSLGPHSVTATSTGPSGTAQLVGTKTVTISNQAAGGQEIGILDAAGDSAGNSNVFKGAPLFVRGWAADTVSGAPVTSVTIYVDGTSIGTATLGSARPDVAAFYGRADYTNSGWSLQASTAAMSTGQHTVTATAVGPSGSASLGSKTVTIQ
jgi:N-acetylmuramoyl-L-alanine amidase